MSVRRNVLLNPGPATTTDTVKMAQVVPDICPREKEFYKIMDQISKDLVRIVHGNNEDHTAVLFCGSGTLCMDVCLNSLLPENKKALIINNGAYSARATEICDYYNLPYINLKLPYDQCLDMNKVEEALKNNADVALVYVTHNETGSGLLNPIKQIGALAHENGAIFVTDTTSSYAMIPINIEKDNIDFCMASAQKGIMAMTGLSYVIGKRKLIENTKDYKKRSYYCNLYMQYDYFERTGEMHFTPPVQTVYSVQQALKEYFAEGEKNKWNRHLKIYEEIRAGAAELGFHFMLNKEIESGLVVTLLYPDDERWDFDKIHDYCYERGYTIYPGKMLGKDTFRLCALGAIEEEDIILFWKIFKDALIELGVKIPLIYK